MRDILCKRFRVRVRIDNFCYILNVSFRQTTYKMHTTFVNSQEEMFQHLAESNFQIHFILHCLHSFFFGFHFLLSSQFSSVIIGLSQWLHCRLFDKNLERQQATKKKVTDNSLYIHKTDFSSAMITLMRMLKVSLGEIICSFTRNFLFPLIL